MSGVRAKALEVWGEEARKGPLASPLHGAGLILHGGWCKDGLLFKAASGKCSIRI